MILMLQTTSQKVTTMDNTGLPLWVFTRVDLTKPVDLASFWTVGRVPSPGFKVKEVGRVQVATCCQNHGPKRTELEEG